MVVDTRVPKRGSRFAFGGLQAETHAWRPPLWIAAGMSAVVVRLVLATYEHTPPTDPEAPKEPVAIGPSAVGSVSAFFGPSEEATHSFVSVVTMAPSFGGLAPIFLLAVWETSGHHPLLPLGPLLESRFLQYPPMIGMAFPAAGIGVFLTQVPSG